MEEYKQGKSIIRTEQSSCTSITIDSSAIVDCGAQIGEGTMIWHFSHICSGAHIGKNCRIGQNVFIANDVVIGNNVKIQNNVSVYDSIVIEDDVFCGPSMVFTNVYNPRSHVSRKHEYKKTLVRKGATIGANATIICGVEIGHYAFIGAGSVVKQNVAPFALMVGVPAKQIGYMCRCGNQIKFKQQTQQEPLDVVEQNRLCNNLLFTVCTSCSEKYSLSNNECSLSDE